MKKRLKLFLKKKLRKKMEDSKLISKSSLVTLQILPNLKYRSHLEMMKKDLRNKFLESATIFKKVSRTKSKRLESALPTKHHTKKVSLLFPTWLSKSKREVDLVPQATKNNM